MLRRGRVEVTGGFLLLMAWLNYCDTQHLLPMTVCAAAFHELGHLFAIRLSGGRVRRLRLSAAGAELQMEGAMRYDREVLCALAGPAVNLLLACFGARLGWLVFTGLNLALCLFNLLPMGALDGGRALYCLLCMIFGPHAAQRITACTDGVLAGLLLVWGGTLVGMGGNITLLVVAVWLAGNFAGQKTLGRKRGLSRKS